jgi:1,4-alpha-glucan branching enzyme/maltooligosyltrehalose trehalohydrolase
MQHHYELPFGATVEIEGSVRFAVWAPGKQAGYLKLIKPEGDVLLRMERDDKGWFRLITREAQPGSLYKYDFGDGADYPDPASRRQPQGIHGPSEVVDATSYEWQNNEWRGRPWNEAAIYELHVGTFSKTGDYQGVIDRLDYLQSLGITAIELMPLAQGPGERSWGYDGAYLYAPDKAYGTPNDLKRLVDAAHERQIQVFLDVVYNHFGPEGTYLSVYAPQFFTDKHKTPWGAAINFDQQGSEAVREFYWNNAIYWLKEYRFDGLRCDAVHAIVDDSPTHIFEEIAMRVEDLAMRQNRHIHIIAENENNVARLLERDEKNRPKRFTAQWNDDFHHNMHVILTGEKDAYYIDYAENPFELLGRCLTEGFAYQGEESKFRKGQKRGENSENIPVAAFVNFLQNHDQAGNRPFGERLIQLTDEAPMRAAVAVLLLGPSAPMVFMGEEWGSRQPFPYFCDFGPELSGLVREGRVRDFAVGDKFRDPKVVEAIPDPTAQSTFDSAVLNWSAADEDVHRAWMDYFRLLLTTRAKEIAPLIDHLWRPHGRAYVDGTVIYVTWPIKDDGTLMMQMNLGGEIRKPIKPYEPAHRVIFSTHPTHLADDLPPWSVTVAME